ncbi:hypothetical protein BGZ65_008274 [Modicella reniformis]|uniref:Large-conductance mechanosensitive channel n=1 Tax=Modicella reniformis TaxID=1440133 RepID=A0A9P6INU1_9FUNG|nr:hypothetical protein BGZ65_008274 [Modicella reniformis]
MSRTEVRERIKGSNVWRAFVEFIQQGNIIDLGVGLVIGGAFSKVLTSFVDDILTPPLGLLISGSNLENWFIVIKAGKSGRRNYTTIGDAQVDGAVTENVGRFMQTAFNFLLVAITLFIIIFTITKLRACRHKRRMRRQGLSEDSTPPPKTQPCQWCGSTVPINALKCMFCTSFLHEKVPEELLNKQPQTALLNMEFPKINVSSKADIQFITEIWRKILYDTLEQHGRDGDPRLMEHVQRLLDQWLENMIKMASSNIDINGIPYEEAIRDEEFEPLDESLGRKLQIRLLQVEELTLEVAERRKRVPEQVKMLLDDAIKRQSSLADRIEFESEKDNSASDSTDHVEFERQDLVAQEYASSMGLLNNLRKTASSNITRLEGAQAVVDEILP